MLTERLRFDRPGEWVGLTVALAALAGILTGVGHERPDLPFILGLAAFGLAVGSLLIAGFLYAVESRVRKERCLDPSAHQSEAAQSATLRLALREVNLDLVTSINRLQKAVSSEKFWSKSEALPTGAWKKHRTYLMQSAGMGQALYWLGLAYERVEKLNKLRSDSGTVPLDEIRGARMQLIPAQYAIQKRLGELGG